MPIRLACSIPPVSVGPYRLFLWVRWMVCTVGKLSTHRHHGFDQRMGIVCRGLSGHPLVLQRFFGGVLLGLQQMHPGLIPLALRVELRCPQILYPLDVVRQLFRSHLHAGLLRSEGIPALHDLRQLFLRGDHGQALMAQGNVSPPNPLLLHEPQEGK
jgi:hypothetical protein